MEYYDEYEYDEVVMDLVEEIEENGSINGTLL